MKILVACVSLLLSTHSYASPKANEEFCKNIENSTPEFEATSHAFKGCRLISITPDYAELGLRVGDVLVPEDQLNSEAKVTPIKTSVKTSGDLSDSKKEQ